MEQKHPADIYTEVLDHLWNGLGLEKKGWKQLKKGDFKKRLKSGLTYQICFDRSRYNYIDYEIGHGNVEVGFTCIIKQGDDRLYSFKIEPTMGRGVGPPHPCGGLPGPGGSRAAGPLPPREPGDSPGLRPAHSPRGQRG